jgi:hypothetical protein
MHQSNGITLEVMLAPMRRKIASIRRISGMLKTDWSLAQIQCLILSMGTSYRRYIAIETAISIVINVAISALFMLAVFGGATSIDLWGRRGLALDFVPQTFMISAMSILVPTLLTRRRIRAGVLVRRTPPPPPILRHLTARIILLALFFTLTLGGIGILALALTWTGPLRFWQAFPIKLLYGAMVALIATPVGLSIALTDPNKDSL